MFKRLIYQCIGAACLSWSVTACITPKVVQRTENRAVPARYNGSPDSTNTASVKWRRFFTDPSLASLIDTALQNNQELNITLQEMQVAQSEIRARKGEYLPTIGLRGAAGVDKVGRYTNIGASE